MITIRLGIGGILRFRLVNSSGAAVTGKVDGDFVSRRYVTETDTWGDLSGTITEGEAGWYAIPMTAGEADAVGQAVAYFSDGTNEAHVTFMICLTVDTLQDGAYTSEGALSSMLESINSGLGTTFQNLNILKKLAGVQASTSFVVDVGGTDTFTLDVGSGTPASAAEVLGCLVVFNDAGLSSQSIVTAYDSGTHEVTVSPALSSACANSDVVFFKRPTPIVLDHPNGVDVGFDIARALRKIGAAVVANNTGAAGAGAGTQIFRNLSDTADEFEGAYDANGNRTITHSD